MKQRPFDIGNIAMILMACTSIVSADVIFPDVHAHRIARCVKIENCGAFPDIAVIEIYIAQYAASKYNEDWGGIPYIVHNDSCLAGGESEGFFYFLWATKSWFDSAGLDNPSIKNFMRNLSRKTTGDSITITPWHMLSRDIHPIAVWVLDSSKIFSEELSYRLFRDSSGISAYLAKRITHFKGGTSKTETFTRDNQPKGINRP